MKIKNIITTVLLGGVIIALTSFSPGKYKGNAKKARELNNNMRKLWEDHITWTRNVVFCIIDDLPGTEEAVKRLQKNQDEIGDAVKPYYGAEAGKKLADLLHTHIDQAAEILRALKKDDKILVEQIDKRWKQNGDDIAEFLSKANPNWKLEEMKKMMKDHLNFLTDEATARKKKDYSADVKAYDKTHDQILEMADMLSDGIVMQFPDKFKTDEKIGTK